MNNTMDVLVSAAGFNYIPKSSYFESKHKSRPSNFKSVAEARIKRTERKSLHRKSARITNFDNCRNISPLANAAPLATSNEAQPNRRWLLLQQWKEEKEKKKREAVSTTKKKPFVVGAVRAPPPLECIPAVPKPSISGRVTRSQATRKQTAGPAASCAEPSTSAGRILISAADFLGKTNSAQVNESFAPANAVFHPPQNIAGSSVATALAKGNKGKKKTTKPMLTFQPVVNIRRVHITEPTQSIQSKANESTLSRKRNHINQSKPTNQTTQHTTRGATKTVNLNTQSKAVPRSALMQDSGVIAFKETDKNIRMTRRNTRLIDKDKQIELKTVQAKCNDTKMMNNFNLKLDKPKSLHTTKDAKVKGLDVEKNNYIKSSEAKTNETKSKAKESETERKNTVMKINSKNTGEVNYGQARSVNSTFQRNVNQCNELKVHSQNTPKKVIPKSESSSEEKLRSPPQDKQLTPEQIRVEVEAMSPCVTVSRGKNNARKEAIEKLKDGLLADDFGDMNTIDHFRSQLSSEIKRLTAVSDDWHKYAVDNVLPEHIQELVLAAVGQTRLLITKKLQQFSQLVEQCASGEARPEGFVTTSDLQGFWDMVFMQVDNVDMRFKKLSELRERQWVSEEVPKPKRKPLAGKMKAPVGAGAPSKIRAMIEAARKAKQTEAPRNVLLTQEATFRKDFDAGFFSVTSPVRDAAAAAAARLLTPRATKSPSLLKDVLSSEARKACSVGMDKASRAIMRASIIAKSMDQEPIPNVEDSPLSSPPRITVEAAPARSILKTPNVNVRATRRKSAKTVLFCDAEEPRKARATSPGPIVTPEKGSPEAPVSNRGSVTKRNARLARRAAVDLENVEPEGSGGRRVTRGMRRSLAETPPAAPATPTAAHVKRTTRTSARLTEVH